jgi:predicted acetyltransferase
MAEALVLRELTAAPADETAFFAGMKAWEGEAPDWYTFSWKTGMSYAEMLEILRKEAAGIDLAPGRVPHTMFYAFVDGQIIGRLSVRHELNDYLRQRGGHFGYAVAPAFRRRGYATEIVRQGLGHCRRLGIREALVTCADSNTPSWKIIERFGGILQDRVFDEGHGEMIRRYRLALA